MPADIAVILPAGGTASRFGSDKLLALLHGKPVLRRSAERFVRADVCAIIVATSSAAHRAALDDLNGVRFADAGTCRAQSVRNALALVPAEARWVAVHDAARPLVSDALIDRAFAMAREHGSAVPALPVKLTIKQATGPLPARVERTLPRSTLWEMQTPQVVSAEALRRAYDTIAHPLDTITDDAQLLELIGEPVMLIDGDERNLKLTTPQDLALAGQLCQI